MSKWTYEDFYREIVSLKSRVRQLEIALEERILDSKQHRIALIKASEAMEKALTEPPVPFSKEAQAQWDRPDVIEYGVLLATVCFFLWLIFR